MKKYIIITLLAILALTVQAQETIKIVPKFKVGQKMLYHVRLENEDRASLSDSFYTLIPQHYNLTLFISS